MTDNDQKQTSRREMLRLVGRVGVLGCLASLAGMLTGRLRAGCIEAGPACKGCPDQDGCDLVTPPTVWQLDPAKCTQCGQCATDCVLAQSAVRCFHTHALCGHCKLCFGYFEPGARVLSSAAENQLCPTGAIQRRFVEDPYYTYTIEKDLCIGCAKCVHGCGMFGNGSLYLQVDHELCKNCNECSIARRCPANAFERVPVSEAYLLKGQGEEEGH
ncbi:MAG: ferredoxin [Verrucomicrobia bacterium]|jgi:Na+-translocating ferredoxin:NAD+ oxidoreductase subunit B|nr:ferredoxin [Verrucomicrobiota bacterium]MBT7065824.1 ferredoxin [Verrucomicrobiota bacterium]MBT7701837.1 ferredoxin [Verrucomicrobiota bacterium]